MHSFWHVSRVCLLAASALSGYLFIALLRVDRSIGLQTSYYSLIIGNALVTLFLAVLAVRAPREIARRGVIFLALTLLALEISYRLLLVPQLVRREYPRAPAPYVGFTLRPHGSLSVVDYSHTPAQPGSGVVRVNADGFRETKTLPPNADRQAVFMLGGSALVTGTNEQETLPALVEEALSHSKPSSIFNFGVSSFVSGQELSLLVHQLVKYRPDAVVLYHGANDIFEPWYYDPRPGYPFDFMITEHARQMLEDPSGEDLLLTLLRTSHLFRDLYRPFLINTVAPLDALRAGVHYRTPAWEQEIVAHLAHNSDRMCAIAKLYKIPLIEVLQPMLALKDARIGGEIGWARNNEFNEYVVRQYEAVRNERKAHADCRFIDLSGSLADQHEQLFTDFVHVTLAANKKLAEAIALTLTSLPPREQ